MGYLGSGAWLPNGGDFKKSFLQLLCHTCQPVQMSRMLPDISDETRCLPSSSRIAP